MTVRSWVEEVPGTTAPGTSARLVLETSRADGYQALADVLSRLCHTVFGGKAPVALTAVPWNGQARRLFIHRGLPGNLERAGRGSYDVFGATRWVEALGRYGGFAGLASVRQSEFGPTMARVAAGSREVLFIGDRARLPDPVLLDALLGVLGAWQDAVDWAAMADAAAAAGWIPVQVHGAFDDPVLCCQMFVPPALRVPRED